MVRFYKGLRFLFIIGIALLKPYFGAAQCNFTNLNSSYCSTDASFTLTGGTTYYGPGVSGSTFAPATAGVGTHTLYTTNGTANTYTVSTAGVYSPDPSAATTVTFPSLPADESSASTGIGFNFTFFGNTYSTLTINANGYLTFGTSNSGMNQTLPNTTAPNNLIAGAWDNLDISTGGTVTRVLVGSAPRRKFIVNFNAVRHAGAAQSVTFQIQLHESTNIIEVHSQNIQFDGGMGMTQGIENAAGTVANAVPGRNNTSWTAASDYVAFIPSCTAQKVVTISGPPSPVVPTTVTNTICTGATAQFTIPTQNNVSYQLWRVSDNSVLSTTYNGTGSSLVMSSNALTATTDIKIHAVNTVTGCQADVYSFSTITVLDPPAITAQPTATQSICEGSNASFSVTATGSALTYQWHKNGVNIPSANASTYSIPNIATADGATYTVTVSNACTSVTSNGSVLTVWEKPEITVNPSSATLCAGNSASFTVNPGVTTSPGYQWYKGAAIIGGATSATYTIPTINAASAGTYSVVVSGSCGPSATSTNATLTVRALTAITTQPAAAQAICEGSPASFTVVASGTGPITYQWRKNGVVIGAPNAATYTIPSITPTDAATYTVVVSNACNSVTSSGSVLTVQRTVQVTTPPAAQVVCEGAPATFTVDAGPTTNPTYQWYKGVTLIGGATSATYSIPATTTADAATYSVSVGGTCGSSILTGAALTVNTAPAITVQPASVAQCEGLGAAFSVTATGTALTYQWRKNGVNIAGQTSSSLSLSNISAADNGTYTVTVTGTCTPPVVSNGAVLTVQERPEITAGPSGQIVCEGAAVNLSVNAGVTTNPTYQWAKGGVDISGATGSTYSIPSAVASDAGSYTVTVSGTCTSPVLSAAANVVVNSAPVISVQPVPSQAVCEGNGASFSVTASGTALTYQWKKNGVDIGGATSATYSISSVSASNSGTYTVAVSGTCFPAVVSNGSVLTVRETPEIIAGPAGQTVCEGATVNFTVNAGVTTNPTYQWAKGGTDILGATSATYSIPGATASNAGSYTVRVSGACNPPITSVAAILVVNVAPVITSQPVSGQAVCEGNNASFSVTATGTSLTYQWKKNGVDIAGASAATYTILSVSASDNATYTVAVSGVCSPALVSNGSVLTVNEIPEVITGPSDQTVCEGAAVTFTVDAGVTTNPTYQWAKDGTDISGATSATYTISSVVAADAGDYTVIVGGACPAPAVVPTATLTVNVAPVITAQPTPSQAICEGSGVTFSIAATGTALTYQWKKNGVDIAGAQSASYSIANVVTASSGTYTVAVSGTCFPAVVSDGAVLTVREVPEIITGPSSQSVCTGGTVSFTVNPGVTTSPTYQWFRNGTPIAGSSATLTIASATLANAGNYTVRVSGACSPFVTSAPATLTVNTPPVIVTQPAPSQAICEGNGATFSVNATGTALTYQWRKNGVDISGAQSATYSISSLVSADAGTYTVFVAGTCAPGVISAASVLNVQEKPEIIIPPAGQTLCEGNSITFTVNAGVTTSPVYQWYKDGVTPVGTNSPSFTISSVTTADAGSYTVDVSGTCGPNVVSGPAVLNVNRVPDASASDASICTGQFTNIAITNPNSVSGTAFTWTVQSAVNVTGASAGSGNLISQMLSVSDGVNQGSVTYLIQPSAAGCNGLAYAVNVIVKPIPTAAASPQSICSGSNTSVNILNPNGVSGTTFSWIVFSTTNVTGASAGSGPTIIQNLTSSDGINSGTVTYRITPTAGGCPGNSVDVTVTVNPKPVITNSATSLSQEICSGASLNFLPTASITGTTFSWSSVVIGSLTSVSASGNGAITDSPVNSSSATGFIIYTITPSYSGCSGSPVFYVVTVRPTPNAFASPQTICSGQSTSISITNPNGVSGTNFVWTVFSSPNVTGASGGSGNTISQLLSSSDNLTNGVVTYRIVPSANGCPGAPFFVTATVKPVPVITNSVSSLSQQICSDIALSFVPTSSIAGTVFNWTGNISGPIDPASVTASSSGSITDAPKNTGNIVGTVVYRIAPQHNGCAGVPVDFIVTVNPLPSASAADLVICSGQTAVVNISPAPQNVAGTTFIWTATPTLNVTGAADGDGSVISQTLSTTNSVAGSVVYAITPTANTCPGIVKYVTVTVNPIASVNAGADFAVCEPISIPVSGTLSGSATSGAWSIVSGMGAGTISGSTVAGNIVTATYTVAGGDIGGNVVLRLTTNDPDASGPCSIASDDVSIAVNRQARVTLPADYVVCEPSLINLTGTLSGSSSSGLWSKVAGVGTLSATSVTGSTAAAMYNVALPGDVTNTLTFRLTTNDPDGFGPCVAEHADINIHINESAKVSAGADFQVCEDKVVNLNGSFSGTTSTVTWSGGSGASRFSSVSNPTATYSLTPADITAGSITLTLTTNDPDSGGPCGPASDQVFIKVNKLPIVSFFNLKSAYAENNPIEVLEGFPAPPGGVFTGPGIIAGTSQFNPATAGYGLIAVTYTYTDGNSCVNSFTRNTVVNPVTTIDFDIEKQTTDVNGLPQICAESGSLRLIGYPSVNDPTSLGPTFFSSADPAIAPRISSITTGSNTEFYLNTIGLVAGSYSMSYTFKNTAGAETILTKTFTVFPAPKAIININNGTCIKDDVIFKDNSFIPLGTTVTYAWTYGEGGNGNDGVSRDPSYRYQASGLKHVTLTVTTNQGCSNIAEQDIRIGPVPVVDFSSTKFCSGLETTEFKDATVTGGFSTVADYSWNFGDGDVVAGAAGAPVTEGGNNSGTYTEPKHRYTQFKVYDVELTVTTNDGCTAARTKKIFILDYNIPSPTAGYSIDFANGPGSWVAVTTPSGTPSDTSWVFGPPNGNNIKPSAAGHNAWWTGGNPNAATDFGTYYNNENSQVIGPCLNLENLKRPMIAINYWCEAQPGFDGAVVQYSVDGGNNWETIGNADGYGINWYSKRDVSSEPGGQDNFAWSDTTRQWHNARFNLDKIPVNKRALVVFRVAFASNDDNQKVSVLNGFAFDHVYIGEKNRNVLVEHFTNTSSPSVFADTYLKDLYDVEKAAKDSSDFFSIQYHMSSPQFDPLNRDNPVDPEARALFYGVSQAPTTIMDGIQGQYFNTVFTGGYAKITRDEIDRRALEDPRFAIKIDSVQESGNNTLMRPRITYTYIDSTKTLSGPIILQAALIERGAAGMGSNVVRKLLLQSEGRTVNRSWVKGDFELATIEYDVNVPILNSDSLFLVAFVQEQNTPRRILQSNIVPTGRKKGVLIVGVDDPILAELNGLNIYPNPATKLLNFSTDIVLKNGYTWKLVDQRGVTVLAGNLNRDFTQGPQQVDVSGLANGIYVMSIQTGQSSVVYRKIAVMN
ncbi:immunoglobulin domain-containing protein [Chryseolinea lacunae]|uniref:Immunoglobulin domain-containing protein n=1 Tax=Chryseolinea lacunae TaxID=2801331 RepID=A0ABS1L090_9BACT|nr:immunoglobulin domain-containing protein [Chryseolinea lacunae]MBL0744322.1 immunoglobulin domain-containing protein [Chryseolinea lacunae]